MRGLSIFPCGLSSSFEQRSGYLPGCPSRHGYVPWRLILCPRRREAWAGCPRCALVLRAQQPEWMGAALGMEQESHAQPHYWFFVLYGCAKSAM
ncbi:hypothetical protein CV_1051 [Chromobacterium violaceum ATCC 12472]|uniref:Uncharacterized protein n=1 Tax=Chromobacterium violaceum (strain ATCC 12472 / DSM 30191 / JCM 1249 / CCUG 213 / NBRC 12614 / NCIMB 9131 / NCTC 9757 / MK) TaxID=243365 RepID=Q7NZ71_CHRVO|nr:hypothetical protein CV_1051 [Chromobacterium violaceum ATCC 12472]